VRLERTEKGDARGAQGSDRISVFRKVFRGAHDVLEALERRYRLATDYLPRPPQPVHGRRVEAGNDLHKRRKVLKHPTTLFFVALSARSTANRKVDQGNTYLGDSDKVFDRTRSLFDIVLPEHCLGNPTSDLYSSSGPDARNSHAWTYSIAHVNHGFEVRRVGSKLLRPRFGETFVRLYASKEPAVEQGKLPSELDRVNVEELDLARITRHDRLRWRATR
jgi:hypothetical protein